MACRSGDGSSSPFLSPMQPDIFEFMVEFRPEMCVADDIFLHGCLQPHEFTSLSSPTFKTNDAHLPPRPPCTPSGGKRISKKPLEGSKKGGVAQIAEYRKLQPWPERPVTRSKSREVAEPVKPKWQMLTLGPMRMPEEMGMKTIRARQSRRSQSTKDARHNTTVISDSKSPWRLLNSLSCRASVDITTPASLFVIGRPLNPR